MSDASEAPAHIHVLGLPAFSCLSSIQCHNLSHANFIGNALAPEVHIKELKPIRGVQLEEEPPVSIEHSVVF